MAKAKTMLMQMLENALEVEVEGKTPMQIVLLMMDIQALTLKALVKAILPAKERQVRVQEELPGKVLRLPSPKRKGPFKIRSAECDPSSRSPSSEGPKGPKKI